MLLSTISANSSQSTQRVTDWRSLIGSNGLAVVGDFMDSLQLNPTEAWKEAVEKLLEEKRYVYLKTRDATEGGKPVVCKATISVPTYPLKVIQVKKGGCY